MAVDLTAGGAMRAGVSVVPLRVLGDERLARMVGGEDERAFAALYGRYRQPLYGYCYSILCHAADAQDALQSTFAAAYAALRDGRRDAPLRPWLYRIAHNEAVSVLRRRRAHGELSEEIPASGGRVEDCAAERERLALLVADLRQLPERQRSALIMREFSGMSHNSIAVALRTSVAAAKQAIFEARRSLAELERGRSMSCQEVCRIVSDRDGRALRSRRVRSHLRACAECGAFAAAIPRRSADLRALGPALAPTVAAGVLARAMGGVGSGVGGPGSAGVGIEGTAALGLANVKVAAALLLTAATTVGGALEVNRLLPGSRSDPQQQRVRLLSERESQRASDSRLAVLRAAAGRQGAGRRADAGGKPVAGRTESRAAQTARGSTGVARVGASGSVAGARSGPAGPSATADADDPSADAGDAPPPSDAVRGWTQRSHPPGPSSGRGLASTPPGAARGSAGRGSASSSASPGQPLHAEASRAGGAQRSTSTPADARPATGAGPPGGGAGPQLALPPASSLTGSVPPGLAEPRTPRGTAHPPA
jgi:RNA polymerase sigma factor (sigma-70 family)